MKKINLLFIFFTLIVIPNILFADAYSSKYKAGKGKESAVAAISILKQK